MASSDSAAPVTFHPTPILRELATKAKSPQTALIPGNGDPVGYWLTPPDLMKELDDEFKFDFDACPFPRPAGFDGRQVEWGNSTYVNPPFVGPGVSPTSWARKCREEAAKGKTTVMIWPIDGWIWDFLQAGAQLRPVRKFDWLDPKGKPAKSNRPHLLFILKPDASVKLPTDVRKCLRCGAGREWLE